MFWADRIAQEILDTRTPRDGKRFLIRDEKTLSGRVHIGSMRGVAIHGLISEVLAEKGAPNEYRYELNDFDDFDTVPAYLDQARFVPYLGSSLFAVPSPESGFENFAEFFGAEYVSVHEKAGFRPSYYRAYKDLYKAGKMDACITTALKRKDDIRRILKAVSGSDKDDSWFPVSAVCEKCGKIKTTRVTDFDGETIGYVCDQSPYGSVPCGHAGRRSPLQGGAKLYWKVDWAAKWKSLGVDIEGGGKDHSTKGGSRDVANHISKEVFDFEPPFDIPYEFFLVGGQKMSSSKGRGSSAKDMADLFPPQELRLALIGKDIREQINMDPAGESIPRMYDWYDELSEHFRETEDDDYGRLYTLTQLPQDQAAVRAPWRMRFREVAFIVQMRHLSLEKEAETAKGSALTDEDRAVLIERAEYAKFWLATYAPEEFKYVLQDSMPDVELSDIQRTALALLSKYMEVARTGEEIHARLHELKEEAPIAPRDLFQAIYRAFLARDSGPKAGWFLAGLPLEFVQKRLSEAASK